MKNKVPPEELFELADELSESAREYQTFEEWLEHIESYRERIRSAHSVTNDNTVKISTLHSCKGKEYDIVYILDVNDGVIPYHKARLDREIEEERRLFYVGMTRAKNRLNIFAVNERYEKKQEISPFIKKLIDIYNG